MYALHAHVVDALVYKLYVIRYKTELDYSE